MSEAARTRRLPRDHLPVVAVGRADIDSVKFPDVADLMARLHFSTRDGRIWLDDQRMLLIHAKALGELRRELIESLGFDAARGFMTRMGYHAGAQDARMARKVRSTLSAKDMFVVGPQMHCLEGIGLSAPVRLEFDVERGTHYGEFVWTNAVEDEEHARHFGIGLEPTCWMQIGYASGYTSEFMGRPVLYREVECQSMGLAACRIVGKPVEEWGADAGDDLRVLRPESFTSGLSVAAAIPGGLPVGPVPPAATSALGDDSVVGLSPGFNSVCHMVRRVAATQATVLFLGESGVGKGVFARALYRMSARSGASFMAVNCAALTEDLVEAELFGVEQGAHGGALQARPGRFERADGGTLFLDEIGSLSLSAQSKLLRVLQQGEFERVGDAQTRRVSVRVVAATNVGLREEVNAGRFREDLFYRLNVFPIRVPPLRERPEDIPILMNHFLAQFMRRHGRRLTGFTQRAVDAMLAYEWPGNIRELENVVERGVILGTEDGAIDVAHLFTSGEQFSNLRFGVSRTGGLTASEPPDAPTPSPAEAEVDRVSRRVSNLLQGAGDDGDQVSLDDIEAVLLKKAVERARGNLSAASRVLGITRPQLVYRLKSRGIVYQGE
jgi:DNA-binding NtrC family response regulator